MVTLSLSSVRWLLCLYVTLMTASLGAQEPLDIDFSMEAFNDSHGSVDWSFDAEWSAYQRFKTGRALREMEVDLRPSLHWEISDTTELQLGLQIEAYQWPNTAASSSDPDPTSFSLDSSEIQLSESFWLYRPQPTINISFGRQVLAWGESVFFHADQLTDLVNPRDYRNMALTSLVQTRLPVLLSRWQHIGSQHSWEAVVVHEQRPHWFAPEGSDFDPYVGLRQSQARVHRERKHFKLISDWYIRRSGSWQNGDYSIVLGERQHNTPILVFDQYDNDTQQLTLKQRHLRQAVIGFTVNQVVGDVVWKTEHLWSEEKVGRNDIPQSLLNGAIPSPWHHSSSLQSMFGVDYFSAKDISLNVELSNKYLLDFDQNMAATRNNGHLSGVLNWQPSRQKFSAELLLLQSFPYRSEIKRAQVNYRVNGQWRVQFGAINYSSSDPRSVYFPFKDQGRYYLGIGLQL